MAYAMWQRNTAVFETFFCEHINEEPNRCFVRLILNNPIASCALVLISPDNHSTFSILNNPITDLSGLVALYCHPKRIKSARYGKIWHGMYAQIVSNIVDTLLIWGWHEYISECLFTECDLQTLHDWNMIIVFSYTSNGATTHYFCYETLLAIN